VAALRCTCLTGPDFITAPSVALSQRRIATRAPAVGVAARLLYFARFPTTPFSVPPMKLIGSLTSPYVRKVRVVMAEKKLDYKLELENVWSADTQIQKYNPLGKVPCLVME